jgi:hypothetical protein
MPDARKFIDAALDAALDAGITPQEIADAEVVDLTTKYVPDQAAGIKSLLLSLYRMNPPSAEDCWCCQGGVEDDVVQVCDACYRAVTTGTRDDHPHPLSAAQQALRDEGPEPGGTFWPGVDDA